MSYVDLRNVDTGRSERYLLGGPIIESYGFGWEEVSRPKRTGFLKWNGESLVRLQLPLRLEGWLNGFQQNTLKAFLVGSARSSDGKRPDTFTCSGPTFPAFHKRERWVIEGLDPGDDALYNDAGLLLRQSLSVTLAQFEGPDFTVVRKPAARPRYRMYTTVKGDTLRKIAKRKLGKIARWTEIRDLNKGNRRVPRDGRKVIAKGVRIRIPLR